MNYTGAWRVPLSSLTSILDPALADPVGFALEQNYPNPFNPQTTITYRLKTSADVVLKIYDVKGNLVSALINGRKDAGSYDVQWDGSNYASGLYFHQLELKNISTVSSDALRKVKQMLLIK